MQRALVEDSIYVPKIVSVAVQEMHTAQEKKRERSEEKGAGPWNKRRKKEKLDTTEL